MLQTRACLEKRIPMSFSTAGSGPSGPQMNVTPLIDVLLTLIIVFMVVVAMSPDKGEEAQLPQPDQKETAEAKQSSTIVIQVLWSAKDQPPTVKINHDDVRWQDLEARLTEISTRQDACLLSIGWGGGLLGKSAYLNTQEDAYRQILKQVPLYQRAIQTGLPFPKTRRVIFEANQPASLPGWVLLELS